MGYDQRSAAWLTWMAGVRRRLLQAQFGGAPDAVRPFFLHHWTMHSPALFAVPPMPAMEWSLAGLRRAAGDIEVEVQAGRASDPDYEVNKMQRKMRLPFAAFLEEVEQGEPNDVYLTASNTSANGDLMARLDGDLRPLPEVLQPGGGGFLWLGRGSRTPLHHDLSNLLMVQLVGERGVYLIPPSEQPRLDNDLHVFSRMRFVEEFQPRGIAMTEVRLTPGDALFVPVGWWHAVDCPGLSIMASFTGFWWPNHWTEGFPP